MPFNWTCPHCSQNQTVVDRKAHEYGMPLKLEDQAEGEKIIARIAGIGCSNPECRKVTVRLRLGAGGYDGSEWCVWDADEYLFDQFVYPQGVARPQPEFIPKALRDDYFEACLIRDLSPKAAATLIRRCLQGMIRDFAGIAKGTLNAEINALRSAVEDGSADRAITPETVDAIDHVRGIGNIGAHMEKDIDLIVEVDPGEAQALIELVELLFEEWYVAREQRKAKLARIAGIAEEKKIARKPITNEADAEAKASDGGSPNALLSSLLNGDRQTDKPQ